MFKVLEKNGFSSMCEFAVRNVIDSVQSYSGGMISLDNAQLSVIKISELFKTDLVEDDKENLEIKEVTIHSITKIISMYERKKNGKIHIEGRLSINILFFKYRNLMLFFHKDFYKAMEKIGCGFACKLAIYEVANSIEKISGGFISVDSALKAVVKLAKIFNFFRIKL